MRLFSQRLLAILLFAASTAFGGEIQYSGEIVLGATFPRTGTLEDYGLSAYYGANTAVRMINEAGGINGKSLRLEWRDNESNAKLAEQQIRELVQQYNVPAVLGPLMSDAALQARRLARELEVVLVSPMATADSLSQKDPWVFRTCFNISAEAEAMVRFNSEKYGALTCVILYDPRYTFSRELTHVYQEKIAESGGACLGIYSIFNSKGEKDYPSALRRIAAANPDYVFIPCYALEAMEIIQHAKALNMNIRLCGNYTWDNQVVFDGSGTRLAGTAFASALLEQASSRSFRAFFSAMEAAGMDNPDAPAACAYDAVMLLAEALKNGESPREIRDSLLAVRNLMLATGRVSITEDGNAVKPVLVRIVERIGYHLVPVYAERYDPPRQPDRRQQRQ